ncbi:MAG: hypothetical protein BWY25_02122 [Chloroflexi bacterium ADurb.Bin222]|nr:MAG: hypothetical protein BWY25_02122 [Chloroflexi bacterium ADurb.Bin222]
MGSGAEPPPRLNHRLAQALFSRPYRTGLVGYVAVQALKYLPTLNRRYATRLAL